MKKKEMFLLVCLAIIMLAAAAAVISFGWSYGGHWQRLLLSATYGVQV